MKRTRHGRAGSASSPAGKRRLPIREFRTSKFRVPIPKDEPERLIDLQSYQVLDTPPEDQFDYLTRLASETCGTPIALVSLLDTDRQWFKSKVGLTMRQTAREHAFCAHAIMGRGLFVVQDTTRHKHFASNPLVLSYPKIRFYAGMPLISPEDHALGTLCVMDRVPRDLSPQQRHVLELLSEQVITQLIIRRQMIELKQALREWRGTERQLRKEIRTAHANCRANRRWIERLHREIQAATMAMNQWADQQGSESRRALPHGHLEPIRNVAAHLSKQTRDILRHFRGESAPG